MKGLFGKLFILAVAGTAGIWLLARGVPSGIRLGGLGIQTNAYQPYSETQVTPQDLQAAWVRLDIPWEQMEPLAGQISGTLLVDGQPQSLDGLLETWRQDGVQTMLTLTGGPVYLPHQVGSPVDGDAFIAAWETYLQALVDRYTAQVDVWQISDRINDPSAWAQVVLPGLDGVTSPPDPALYARMLTSAYRIIHSADPGDRVVTGGVVLSSDPGCDNDALAYLAQLAALGADTSADALGVAVNSASQMPDVFTVRGSLHDTTSGTCLSDQLNTIDLAGQVRGVHDLSASVWDGLPVWITSIGWSQSDIQIMADLRGGGTLPSGVQAELVARAVLPLIAEPGVDRVYWHALGEDQVLPGQALDPVGQQAYANVADLLDGAVFQTSTLSNDVRSVQVEKAGRTIIFLWRVSGGDQSYPVNVTGLAGMDVRAYAVDSPSLSNSAGVLQTVMGDGSILVAVSEHPVILIAQASALPDRAYRALQDGAARLRDNALAALSDWVDTQKIRLRQEVNNWFDDLKASFLTAISDQIDQWFSSLQNRT